MSSSAKRALRILESVGRAENPVGVSEVARRLSLSPGTVFRSLDALGKAGLVTRYQASARYVLGPAAERLRHSLIATFRMRDVCLPYLRQLASLSGETTSLHVRLGWYGVRIASVPGSGEVTNSPPLGEASPLGNTYSGEAILAFLSESDIAHYRVWAAKHGIRWSEKQRELHSIAMRGFAAGETAFEDGMAVALPIRSGDAAIAAIAIEGPVFHPQSPVSGISDWSEILGHVEALVRAQPHLFENPFAHLDPESILLGELPDQDFAG
jgi:DNA-binding IclR family transcriptional regulator